MRRDAKGSLVPVAAGSTRRQFLRKLALLLAAIPLSRLGGAVARADKRRRNHLGVSHDLWIGHC